MLMGRGFQARVLLNGEEAVAETGCYWNVFVFCFDHPSSTTFVKTITAGEVCDANDIWSGGGPFFVCLFVSSSLGVTPGKRGSSWLVCVAEVLADVVINITAACWRR